MKKEKGITLIALVITIIVLIILATVTINLTLGSKGIFNKAKEGQEQTMEAQAKEKLEVSLDNALIEKVENKDYNKEEYLTNLLEQEGFDVNDEIVTVEGYSFLIDREKLKILESLGVSESAKLKFIVDISKFKNATTVEVLLMAESDKIIKNIEILNPDNTLNKKIICDDYKVSQNLELEYDKEYIFNIVTEDLKVISKKIIKKIDDPISTPKELQAFRDAVNYGISFEGKTIILNNDIDLTGFCGNDIGNWTPIGNTTNFFKGTFDGKNHKIENVSITIRSTNYQGLFGYNSGTIQNLSVYGAINSSESFTGILVGQNNGTVRNVTTNGVVSGWNYTGGITGYNSGIIENCINNAEVTYPIGAGGKYGKYVGGIAGSLQGKIQKCINNGNITGNFCTGGIVGLQGGTGEIEKCVNKGIVTGNRDSKSSSENVVYAAGISGYLQSVSSGKIKNCYNLGTITSKSGGYCSGIIAFANFNEVNYYIIENCYNVGNTSGAGILNYFYGTNENKLHNNYWIDTCGVSYGVSQGSSNDNASPKNEQEFNSLASTLGEEYIDDIKITVIDEETGKEKEVWKYNNGYPILKWQSQ